jgi:hypothetical protein
LDPRGDEVTLGWGKLLKGELRDFYSSPSVITIIKSRRMRWAVHPLGIPIRRWVDDIKMYLGGIGWEVRTEWSGSG